MALLVARLCLALPFLLGQVAHAADAELIAGFRAIVMQPEYSSSSASRDAVRKFPGRVRYRFHNRSRFDRTAEAERFVQGLGEKIPGLDVGFASGAERANFEVFIVDRADYVSVVGAEIYRRHIRRAPGRCVVTAFERSGRIERSVAVIVADEGDALFTRCLNEELAQGLGPLNDDPGSPDSVFNGGAEPLRLTDFDILVLGVLYDPRIRPGMDWQHVLPLLPDVIRDVRARLGAR